MLFFKLLQSVFYHMFLNKKLVLNLLERLLTEFGRLALLFDNFY